MRGQALRTGIYAWHESGRRGQPCSGPGRSGIGELPGQDSGRPGLHTRRTCGGTGKTCRRNAGGSAGSASEHTKFPGAGAGAASRRLPRQQQGHGVGCRSCPDLADRPGVTSGFSHHCRPNAGRPARQPFTLPPNATMVRDRYGQSGCPGPKPRRRHIHAMALPNGPRTEAARASMEPAGRSGRSCHQHGILERRDMRRTMKRTTSVTSKTTHSGRRADASVPARSASGAQAAAGVVSGSCIMAGRIRSLSWRVA